MITWPKGLSLLAGVSYLGIKVAVDSSAPEPSSTKETKSLIPPPQQPREISSLKHTDSVNLSHPNGHLSVALPSSGNLDNYRQTSVYTGPDEAFSKINDYSFRLWSPCSLGTGWILDYQIPEKGKYPTVWYIATNAHVIQYYRFGDNPYQQELPFSVDSTKRLRSWDSRITPANMKYELNHWTSCEASEKNGYFDFSLSQGDTGAKLDADKGLVSRGIIHEPRLFYVPINFLENVDGLTKPVDNHRDFAVLEIEFTSEDYAREYTNSFAEKYDVNTTKAINVFGSPLDSRYSSAWEMESAGTRFYTVAYPWDKDNPKKFEYSKNSDGVSEAGSTLSWDAYWLSGNRQLLGHVDTQKMENLLPDNKTPWNNNSKRLNGVGHLYILKNFAQPGGSSGSLYTDKDGNILGIKRLYEKVSQHSFIVPLRSNRLIADGVVNSPAYDLIKGGVQGQKTSYKDQVERFVIGEKNRKTWLSTREWKHKS